MNNAPTLAEIILGITLALAFLVLGAAVARSGSRKISNLLTKPRASDRDALRGKVAAARFERHIRARLKSRTTPPTANPGPGMRPHPCRSLADAVHGSTPPRPWIIPPADLPDPFLPKPGEFIEKQPSNRFKAMGRPGETIGEWAKRTAKAREEAAK
jgi:hypothetical protein